MTNEPAKAIRIREEVERDKKTGRISAVVKIIPPELLAELRPLPPVHVIEAALQAPAVQARAILLAGDAARRIKGQYVQLLENKTVIDRCTHKGLPVLVDQLDVMAILLTEGKGNPIAAAALLRGCSDYFHRMVTSLGLSRPPAGETEMAVPEAYYAVDRPPAVVRRGGTQSAGRLRPKAGAPGGATP